MANEIDQLRQRILEIDEDLLRLWRERDEAARQIGRLKHRQGLPLQNFEAEKVVLDHAHKTAETMGLSPERARALLRLLIESALHAQERDRVRVPVTGGRRALVVGGAGLMGKWFASFLSEQGYQVFVEDPQPSPFPSPSTDDLFDVVLVATPPSTMPAVLPVAVRRVKPGGFLADIASVKGTAAATLASLAKAGNDVASLHPMFGPRVETLMGRNVLVIDCGRSHAATASARLFAPTAAQTRPIPLARHDGLMAEVLGLSHAASLVFNEALRQGPFAFRELEPVASTTFRKQTDLSREVANENADLYYEIQALNPQTPAMLDRLEKAASELRGILATGDRAAFVKWMRDASAYYGPA